MKKYPQSAIMTPSVQFNSAFYGTNFLDIFPVQFEDFLQKYNLKEYKISNDTFSYLYIKTTNLVLIISYLPLQKCYVH